MNIGIILPGFSADKHDRSIPVYDNLVQAMTPHVDVRVITLRYPFYRSTYHLFGAAIHALGGSQMRAHKRLKLWWDALRLIQQLHREKPFDALHAMWADESGLIASWAGRRMGIPSVVSVAGGEAVGFADIGYGLQLGRLSRWTVRRALHDANIIIVACEYTRQLILELHPTLTDTPIHTIPLGIDAQLFTSSDEAPIPNRLIHVAALHGVKDQATMLRAIAQLPADVTLDIIGDGVDRPMLEALTKQLAIDGRVHFLGNVPHDDMPHYYQRAVLNILPSRHEGQGMVTLEAAACGVPTVGTHVGLLPDVSELGVTVPVGDDVAMAQAIGRLLHEHQQYQALRQSARDVVINRFTIQDTVAQLMALYEALMSA
ncbi:MAG: glycosyltransferase family 4 protein [Chloroflexi bacterium]|nr:MAG: glycosyltransferase family 4 protein [Chloroflexota bacterium]